MPAFALSSAVFIAMAQPAFATGGGGGGGAAVGTASATTAEVGLEVGLLNKAVDVPVSVTLNKISAPASKSGTALSVNIDGYQGGAPFRVLDAKVGDTAATADASGSHAHVKLVDLNAHLPGLPLLSLVKASLISAKADCPANGRPTADVQLPGRVSILGVNVDLSTSGPIRVPVVGVGEVEVDLAKKTASSDQAAAVALGLSVKVNPLNLGVATVEGQVTLAAASCAKPSVSQGGGSNGGGGNGGGNGGSPSGSASASASHSAPAGGSNGGGGNGGCGCSPSAGASGKRGGGASVSASASVSATATGGTGGTGGSGTGGDEGSTGTGANLATTGASSSTPLIAGGAVVAVGAGVGALTLARRRRHAQHH